MAEGIRRLPWFERFGIDEALAARVLSRALVRGGEYAELFFERRVLLGFSLDDCALREVTRSVSMGLAVRVLDGDASGVATTQDLSPEGMLRAAETASAIASGGGSPIPLGVSAVATHDLYRAERRPAVADVTWKVELLRRADTAARATDPRIVQVQASYAEVERELLVVTSDGRYWSDLLPMLRFGVSCIAREGERRETGTGGGGGRLGLEYFDRVSVEGAAREAARSATTMLSAIDAPAGQLPVVLEAGDSGILLHEAVGHGLEADFNRKKTSMYSGRIGERVASELCTVVDDGAIPSSRGSINVDDEGHATGRTVLIENGILRGYMHDRISSRHYGVPPTGNGRRESYQSIPLPRMTNTLLLAGPHDPGEIVASVKRGIYARSFSGGQVDISNGDFVFAITEGYLIEDGKLGPPVRGANLIGNGPEALGKVSMVGHDFVLSDGKWTCGKAGQSVPVGVGMPTLKIDSLTVGGSKT